MDFTSLASWNLEYVWEAQAGPGSPFALAMVVQAQPSFGAASPERFLNANERLAWKRLSQQALPKRRRHWLLGRLAAKLAACEWLKRSGYAALELAGIEVGNNEWGQPYLHLSLTPDAPSVSIAHSGEWAVAVIAKPGQQIGADIEVAGRQLQNPHDFAQLAFTPDEQAFLPHCKEPGWQAAALTLWCAKEAAAKATGFGLRGKPRAFSCTRQQAGLAHIQHGDVCYVARLIAEPGFTLALALPKDGDILNWNPVVPARYSYKSLAA